MFSITRKTDYALVALAGLAAAEPESVSTRELATRLNLPLAVLRNILKELARSMLVVSTHGPRGGYRLARPAARITIAEVAGAIEGPIRFTRCCPDVPGDGNGAGGHACRLEQTCLIRGAIRQVHGQVVDFLGQVTLADLVANRVPAVIGIDVTGRRATVSQPALAGT